MFAGTPYVSALFPFYGYAFSLCFYIRTFFTVGRAVSNIFVGRAVSKISVGRAVSKISVSSRAWIPALLRNMTGNMRTTTYIARPILTYPKYRFQNPEHNFSWHIFTRHSCGQVRAAATGVRLSRSFFGIYARTEFHSNERPYPASRSLCFVLVQILLRNIVCGSAFNLYFIIHFNHLVFRNFPRKQIQNSP